LSVPRTAPVTTAAPRVRFPVAKPYRAQPKMTLRFWGTRRRNSLSLDSPPRSGERRDSPGVPRSTLLTVGDGDMGQLLSVAGCQAWSCPSFSVTQGQIHHRGSLPPGWSVRSGVYFSPPGQCGECQGVSWSDPAQWLSSSGALSDEEPFQVRIGGGPWCLCELRS
jgi:hypothetical protein